MVELHKLEVIFRIMGPENRGRMKYYLRSEEENLMRAFCNMKNWDDFNFFRGRLSEVRRMKALCESSESDIKS